MANFSYTYLIAINLFSLAIALLVTFKTRQYARNKKIGVFPNERMVHSGFIPLLGGIGIFTGFIISTVLTFFFISNRPVDALFIAVIVCGFGIILLGIYDDFKGVNAPRKFFVQFIISTILIYFGFIIETVPNPFGMDIELGVFAVPISYLWLIGVTNAINLIDGLDGLAAGIGLIASLTFAVISALNGNHSVTLLSISLAVGLIAFLKFNYYPASIFMGDTGSLFLGLMLAVLSVETFKYQNGTVPLLLPIIVLAVPIADTAIAFFRRLNQGNHPFKADKEHLHHRLLYLGLTHKQAVYIIYFVSFAYAVTAFLLSYETNIVGILLFVLTLLLSTIGLKRLGYLEARKYKTLYGDKTLITFEKELAPLSLKRFVHRLVLVFMDFITLNTALFIFVWIRNQYGFATTATETLLDPLLLILINGGWIILFFLTDLYNMRWDISRFDQTRRISKTIIFGIIVLFLITGDISNLVTQTRFVILIYGALLILLVNSGRLLVILVEKKFAILAYAPQIALLVGATEKAKKILKDIRKNEHLLYSIIGFVTKDGNKETFSDLNQLGHYKDIPEIIRSYGVQEIIIAINERSHDELLAIVASVDNMKVVFKIIPHFYDVVSGHKTEEVIGHPLIRLFPDHMHLWQWLSKRLFDVLFSLILFFITIPFGIIFYFLLLVEDPKLKPFKIINTVGKLGRVYGMLNYNVNKNQKGLHKILYKTNLYKFPVLINIIMGKMSMVGPRPESPKNVKTYKEKIQFYNRRFQIRPGLTGWAQVKYRYDDSLKSIREQFKQDLFYLENMSLTFDIRILLRSVYILFFKTKS